MINRILTFIVGTLFFYHIAFSQTRGNVNPINVAIKIVEEIDTVRMVETCRYYNLTESPSEDGFQVFKAPDGTTLRFKMTPDSPIVEVITKQKPKRIREYLQTMGFEQQNTTSKNMVDATRQINITGNPTTLSIRRRQYHKYDK